MNALHDKTLNASTCASPSAGGDPAQRPSASNVAVRPRQTARTALRSPNSERRFEQWGCLMVAAQRGQSQAYDQLLRELDVWLRRYYARRLARPAAEDARQDALLAIHAKRHTYAPSKPFRPWVEAIARYKWIDHLRDASRFAALSLRDEMPIEDREEAAISAIVVDDLLGRLKPAQARVIRLVKLQGVSIKGAAGATGQSAALVKVNIHRGLKKLAALAACGAIKPTSHTSSAPRNFASNPHRSTALGRTSGCANRSARVKEHLRSARPVLSLGQQVDDLQNHGTPQARPRRCARNEDARVGDLGNTDTIARDAMIFKREEFSSQF
jgi:RNA polymerase sigma factor (sigma-70 family)